MYPYHNKIKQRIKNGELIGFEFAEDWPKIGSCMLLRFNTLPALRPIRPKRYAEYAPILSRWAQQQMGTQTAVEETTGRALSELEPGEVFKVGEYEFVVLKHCAGYTSAILKTLLKNNVAFGTNNNYAGSEVDKLCEEFSDELSKIVGEENLAEHPLDLTAEDGLKDYGVIERRACLMTAAQYRMYVSILDKHKIDKWWWLATPFSTPAHEDSSCVKCVSPLGSILDFNHYYDVNSGVRPFCIFKSSIFGS